jgi:hypothetical protein
MYQVAGAVFISAATIVYAVAMHAIEVSNAVQFSAVTISVNSRPNAGMGFAGRSYKGECGYVIGALLALGVIFMVVGFISDRRIKRVG